MDFRPTQEEILTRKNAREFAVKYVKPLAAEIDEEHRFPEETVERLAKYGFMGIPYPKEYEGSGGSFLSYIITIEELARECASTAVICSAHVSLCCWCIYHWGTEEQRREFLPDLCSGRKLGAFALTEANAGTDSAKQETKAVLNGDKWVLNGTKVFVTNGGYSDVFIVFAMTDKTKGNRGITAFLIKKDDPGLTIAKVEKKMGVCASSTVTLVLEDCVIPSDRVLGGIGKGFKVAMTGLDGGRIGIAAQALGIAESAFDETVAYLKARRQFGKPLAQMQALQFEMAAMRTEIEASKLLVYQAADMKDRGLDYSMYASMAKLFASETAMKVTTKAVQFLAGYGYSKEYPLERMMRDAKVTEIYEGTSEVQKMVIASHIFKEK